MIKILKAALILCTFCLYACGTSNSQLRAEGHSESYIDGFNDGRRSGIEEAGNPFEKFVRDDTRFNTDNEYTLGWIAGEAEGEILEERSENIGNILSAGASAASINRESKEDDFDRVAKDALKDVDTSGLEGLGNP